MNQMALLHYSITNGARQLSCPCWCDLVLGPVNCPHWEQWIFNWRKKTNISHIIHVVLFLPISLFVLPYFSFYLYLSDCLSANIVVYYNLQFCLSCQNVKHEEKLYTTNWSRQHGGILLYNLQTAQHIDDDKLKITHYIRKQQSFCITISCRFVGSQSHHWDQHLIIFTAILVRSLLWKRSYNVG